jgi:subtilisin family serine protease
VDGQRINLTPSLDWVSVKFVSADASEQETATGKFSSTVVSLAGAREIPHLGLTLLPLQDGLGTKSLVQGVNSMRASPTSFSQVNPVYAYDGVDMVVSDEFVAAFPPSASMLEIAAINAEHGVEVVSSILEQANTFVLRVTSASALDALAMANLYQESGLALYAAPNFARLTAAGPAPSAEKPTPVGPMFTPNDSYYVNDQWYLNNTQQYGAFMTLDADIDAPEAWDITKGASSIVIAVIDEGVDLTHIDLSGNLIAGYDATGLGSAGAPSGDDAHGTAVAGIAAADSNNAQGIAGVCQLCKIMPVRIAYGDGSGGWVYTDAWAANGITWAYTNGADVLNNSWGGGLGATVVNTAITNAVTNGRGGTGSVVVVSAGNDNNASVSWPASQGDVIAVGALNMCDQRKNPLDGACGGNEGWGSNFGAELDIMAGGVWLTTTDIMGDAGYSNSSTPTYGADYTGYMNGTSGAAPIVSGVVGLMLSINTYMTPAHVQEVLQATADDLGAAGRDNDTGYGRANAAAAVAAAQKVDLVITGYELRNEAKTEVITNPSANESFWIRMTIKNRGGTNMGSFYPGVFLDGKPNYGTDHSDDPSAYPTPLILGEVTNFSDYRSTSTASAFNGKGCLYYDPGSLTDPLTQTVTTERGNYTLASFIPELPLNTSSAVDVHIAYPADEFPDSIYDTIRTGLSAGTYPIYLYADPTCLGAESFEDNNAFGPITVDVGVQVEIYVGTGVAPVDTTIITSGVGDVGYYPNTVTGPVRVVSTSNIPIFASERAIYGTTFEEIMGYPANQFTTEYWFTWYDTKSMGTWILVGNPSSTETVEFDVFIAGQKKGSYDITPAEGREVLYYPNMPGSGPVRIVSTNNKPIFTSERGIYNDSFTELMGYPTNKLATEYWFTWYDTRNMGTWILTGTP